MMGRNNEINVKYISYRVEFQGRGAAHIHGTLWLDLKKIEKSKTFTENESTGKLFEAFISCSLDPAIVTQEVVNIALAVNCHHCTRKCENRCKYNFPRFPIVFDKHEFDDSDEEESTSSQTNTNYRRILQEIQEILKDEDKLNAIMQKFPRKGETKEENYHYRAERIDEMLELAGDIKYEDYIMAMKKAKKHGSTVIIQRDVDEIYVNNYNPEWLMNWNANIDIQPVLDFFAVITYVTDYWAKPDEGLTPILKEAAKQLRSEPERKKRCQQMANTFMTNRQMGEAEAYYKVLPYLISLVLVYIIVLFFIIKVMTKIRLTDTGNQVS